MLSFVTGGCLPKLVPIVLVVAPVFGQDQTADALFRARTMAKALERVDDSRLAIGGLAKLGSIVCRHDVETATYIFRTAAARQNRAQSGGSLPAWLELIASAKGCSETLAR